ncbi:MAG: TVP38/TMEM64 family protein [Coriobacteriaceae bacterium]|nr:TVP38/TMEM64 family protein [Coriobacteriaceae bacterium]
MKYFSWVFNAFLWSLTVTMFCYGFWKLYFNVGLVFYGCFIALSVLLILFGKKMKWENAGAKTTAYGVLAFVMCGLMFRGPTWVGIMTSVASFMRQGLFMPHLSLSFLRILVTGLIVVGFGIILAYEVKHPKHFEYDPDPDKAKMQRTARLSRTITILVVCALIVILCCIPECRNEMGYIMSRLGSGNIDYVKELIRSYGPYAAVVSFLLMILQSLAAPIPAFLITFSNAGIFGWWQGAILSWSSAMAGAAICFFIARFLGRDAVAYFVSNTALKSVDKFFERYGKHAIIICRLLPFMSFDYVSYAAGLTGMSFLDFFVATGIGQLPATIVYSYVGGMLTGSAKTFVTGLLILFAVFALIVMIRTIFKSRHSDMMEEAQDDSTRIETMTDAAN